jgi:hypothetical protein
MLVLGAGGPAMALTLFLHERAKAGQDIPRKLIMTALNECGFEDIRAVHARRLCDRDRVCRYARAGGGRPASRAPSAWLDGRERYRTRQGPAGLAA